MAAVAASAQNSEQLGKNEISGTIGRTFISDQGVPNSGLANSTITHGAGLSFAFSYTRILHTSDWAEFAAEIPVVFDPVEKLHYPANQVPRSYSAIFLTPAARVRLVPNVAVSPWVSFGGGFGHFAASSHLVFSGTNSGDRSVTTGVLQIGAGLDLRIPCDRLSGLRIRAEVRDDWSGMPPLNVDTGKTRQHNYYVGAGVIYRF